jgi:hypothetical protein
MPKTAQSHEFLKWNQPEEREPAQNIMKIFKKFRRNQLALVCAILIDLIMGLGHKSRCPLGLLSVQNDVNHWNQLDGGEWFLDQQNQRDRPRGKP